MKPKAGLLCMTMYDGDILDIGPDIRLVLTKHGPNQIRAYVKAPGLSVHRINLGKSPDPSIDKFDERQVPKCSPKQNLK